MDKPFPPPPLSFPSCKIAKLAIPQLPKAFSTVLMILTSSKAGLRVKIVQFTSKHGHLSTLDSFWKLFGVNKLLRQVPLRGCPQHGFRLHQLDTFYNALNSNDQDSLNSAAGGNFLDKMPRECLKIIESKSKVRQSRSKAIVSKVSTSSSTPAVSSDVAELKDMVRALILDKKNQTPAPASVKAIEQSCVTCGGGHSYQNCPATNDYRDNIQEYVSQAAAVNYNQGNASYRPQMVANQIRPPGFPPMQNHQNNQNRGINFNQNRGNNLNQNRGSNFNQGQVYQPQINQPPTFQLHYYQAPAHPTPGVSNNTASTSGSGSLPSNTIANPKGDVKAITTRSGVSYNGPQTSSPQETENEPEKLLNDKDKIIDLTKTPVNENCSAVILKKFPEKLGDPGRFLIPCDFPEMNECLALADLGASINLMPLSIWHDQSVTFKVGDTKTLSYNIIETVNRVDVIDIACEEYVQEVLKTSESGNPTSTSDLTINSRSPSFHSLRRGVVKSPDLELKDLHPILRMRFGGLIYPISDSPWVSPVHCVPKKGGITVVKNEENELIPTRSRLTHLIKRRLPSPALTGHLPIVACLLGYAMHRARSKRSYGCNLSRFDWKNHGSSSWLVIFSVFGDSFSSCLSHLDKMLQRCEDTNLVLNWEKCHFMVKEGIVLGHKISNISFSWFMRILPDDIIQDFSKNRCRPIDHLLEKETPFIFSKECIEAFETLKMKLTQAPILVDPDWDLPFKIMCDASDFAVGAVLGATLRDQHFKLDTTMQARDYDEAHKHITLATKKNYFA
ncbi:reverse transcriptase domain-containing protein [Tanacetum coccineum]